MHDSVKPPKARSEGRRLGFGASATAILTPPAAKTDPKDDDLRLSLLDETHFIAMAWDRVTPTTIANCFAKCGFFRSPAHMAP
ncbi:hypothetical protein HPB48_017260 [Haemaphysalis longicornis]|uniref:Uncharacterized protein n=1 Tax=Haemaphysalis longicornis TaxID=44386 RepID=A0A9J6GIS0_HAELO|nr:hypothetical protein HPB48_017260 [Haemaphysalis longicornis]